LAVALVIAGFLYIRSLAHQPPVSTSTQVPSAEAPSSASQEKPAEPAEQKTAEPAADAAKPDQPHTSAAPGAVPPTSDVAAQTDSPIPAQAQGAVIEKEPTTASAPDRAAAPKSEPRQPGLPSRSSFAPMPGVMPGYTQPSQPSRTQAVFGVPPTAQGVPVAPPSPEKAAAADRQSRQPARAPSEVASVEVSPASGQGSTVAADAQGSVAAEPVAGSPAKAEIPALLEELKAMAEEAKLEKADVSVPNPPVTVAPEESTQASATPAESRQARARYAPAYPSAPWGYGAMPPGYGAFYGQPPATPGNPGYPSAGRTDQSSAIPR